jgi:hypothetical protein
MGGARPARNAREKESISGASWAPRQGSSFPRRVGESAGQAWKRAKRAKRSVGSTPVDETQDEGRTVLLPTLQYEHGRPGAHRRSWA